jgi:hypothetical protein
VRKSTTKREKRQGRVGTAERDARRLLAKRREALRGLAQGGGTTSKFLGVEGRGINMGEKNNTDNNQQVTREYLESLTNAELRAVMDSSVYSTVLMEHLEGSEVLTRRVTQILEEDYVALPPVEQEQEQARVTRLTALLTDRYSDATLEEREFLEELAKSLADETSGAGRASAGAGARADLQALPAEILAAGRALGLSVTAFLKGLLGFSIPSVARARAAAETIELVAHLERFRGGLVAVELGSSGEGLLRGRFDYPESIQVYVYDVKLGEVIPVLEEGGITREGIAVNSGQTIRKIRLANLPEDSRSEDLRLIVLRSEEFGGGK